MIYKYVTQLVQSILFPQAIDNRASNDAVEITNCPLCNSCDSQIILRPQGFAAGVTHRFPLSCCLHCGFVFSNPRVPSNQMDFYYGNNYFGNVADLTISERSKIHSDEWKKVLLKTQKTNESWALDVGAGTGEFLSAINASGWKSVGIEPTSHFLHKAKLVSPCSKIYPDLSSLRHEHPELRFDVILLNNVLEHVPDPVAVLSELRTLLTEEGHLVVKIPSIGSWEFDLCGEFYYGLQLPHHYSQFTPNHLRTVFNMAGFSCYRIDHIPVSFLGLSRALFRGLPVFPLMQEPMREFTDESGNKKNIYKYSFGSILARIIGTVNSLLGQSPMIRGFAKATRTN